MRIWMLLFALMGSMACGDAMQERENRRLAQGYTPCNDFPEPEEGGVICSPNQYCASQQHNWCHTGCLSDDNCSHEQTCIKRQSASIGECVAIDALPDPNPDLDPGYTQCGDPAIPKRYSICHPSQYCYSYYLGDCSGGCLSEDNCTENQACLKEEGENVGVCVGLTAAESS